jgi:arsenite/tail-anchored protein-transporting ATPase
VGTTRLVLITGKGGVGKTTTAAATAAHAARCGVRTLVASADPAHSLGDALGTTLGAVPAELAPGLFAQQIDARARGERSWREVQRYLVAALGELGVDPLAAEELTELPGAEEVLSLLEVRDQVASGDWDLVVLDCAPSAETLRLLALPEVVGRYVRRLLPMERRIARVLAHTARPAMAGVPMPADNVVAAAERLATELAAVREVLVAPETSVRLVMTPETVVLAETRRTWTSLALHGFRVDQVVANRVFDGARDAWRRRWNTAQQAVLVEAAASFHPVPLLRAGYGDEEPVGVEALAAFGERLLGPAAEWSAEDVLAPAPEPAGLDVERVEGGFVLGLSVPLARRDELELGRRGDDLVVTVSGRPRVVALPGALRRCTVAGAALRDGRLAVRFEPDPAQWRTV